MKQNVAVAISGGIDSLYAAHLLIRAGHDVTGIHFMTGYGGFPNIPYNPDGQVITSGKPDENTVSAMSSLSARLGIPVHIIDASALFEKHVVAYFVDQYQSGSTPNPCLFCNPIIKFGFVLDYALSIGAERLATGHYARIEADSTGIMRLYKGKDAAKDQSYFLAFMNQHMLKHVSLPLGDLTKSEITRKAHEAGISPLTQKESQDVCFIKDDYKDFLLTRPGFRSEKGDIRTGDGKKVGVHNGLHSFTIGQRRGINCPAPFPYYVTRLDTRTNTLFVGPKEELLRDLVTVKDSSWISDAPDFPFEAVTRIRYAHQGVSSTLTPADDGRIEVACHEPVLSVTPGQGAVFYRDDEVLGGGLIV